jgi:hypothetical protein
VQGWDYSLERLLNNEKEGSARAVMNKDVFMKSSSIHAGDAEAEGNFLTAAELGNRLNRPKRRRQSFSTDNALTFALAVHHQIPLRLLFIHVQVVPLESISLDHFES